MSKYKCYSVSHKIRVLPNVCALTKTVAHYIAVGANNSFQFASFRPRQSCTVELVQNVKPCFALDTDSLPSVLRTQGVFFFKLQGSEGYRKYLHSHSVFSDS